MTSKIGLAQTGKWVGQISTYSNLNVVALNPYGTSEIQNALQSYLASQNPPLSLSGNYSNIYNYKSPQDFIANMKNQIGNVCNLTPSALIEALYSLGLRGMGLISALSLLLGEKEAHMGILNSPFNIYGNPSYQQLFGPISKYFELACGSLGTVHDPIILDLNGDGVKTTAVNNGSFFDYSNDGFAETTAWADSNDGVLVVDSNSDGVISGSEILTHTALETYDTNSDGVINSNDTNFSNLKILKGNGLLESLTDASVASINIATTATNANDANGNTQIASGTYINTSGTTLGYGEYNLQTQPTYSISTNWVDVSSTIEALPDMAGYGKVDSLHQAMAKDTSGTLTSLVQNFVAEANDANRWGIVDSILGVWSGTDSVRDNIMGPYANTQHLAALQKFMGKEYVSLYDMSTSPTILIGPFFGQPVVPEEALFEKM